MSSIYASCNLRKKIITCRLIKYINMIPKFDDSKTKFLNHILNSK